MNAQGNPSLLLHDTLKTQTAQSDLGTISGYTINENGKPLEGIILRALRLPDSSVVNGAASDSTGYYFINHLPLGRYVLHYSAIGFGNGTLPIVLTARKPDYEVPDLTLSTNDVELSEAVVTGNATPVTVINDTVAYNASAYNVTEGAMVDELIEALPGAEITDDGKITINGKEYSKILIDGKEYFGNDPQATLKNLPANIIKRIKTYDRKSERARLTGIEDGEENNVIDIEIKPNMFKGIIGNIGLSAGNHDRYNMRLNANKFRKDQHLAVITNMNNVNNPVFQEKGNGASNYSSQARPGFTASKAIGITFAKDKKKLYEISGNARYGYTNNEQKSESHSETAYNNGTYRFSDSNNHSERRRHEFNIGMKMEWKPDTLTTFQLRPDFSYNKTDNWSQNNSASQSWNGKQSGDTIGINTHQSSNVSNSEGAGTSIDFDFFRRLSRTGRSISFNSSFNYSNNESNTYARNILLYNLRPDRNRNYNRYIDGNGYSMGYNLGVSYNEPIFKNSFLQVRYSHSYRRQRSNRYGYQLDRNVQDSVLIMSESIDWDSIPVDTALSSCSSNSYTSDVFHVNMRHNTPKFNLSYGVNINPRHNETNYIFGKNMHKGLVKQNLINWSPSVAYKYRFNKRKTLDLSYSGNSNDPDIDELQEVIDKTNPQYIRYGNPNLKPSFTNNLRLDFNFFGEKSHRSFVSNWGYSTTNNSTSNMILRESSTGVSVAKLMNVDGRWSMNGNINFNTPLDSAEHWHVSTSSSIAYNEYANYNSTPLTAKNIKEAGITGEFEDLSFNDFDKLAGYARKNHTQNLRLHQDLQLRFHLPEFSWKIDGGITYNKIHNSLRTSACRETFVYNANADFQLELPFNAQLSSRISYISRHGFSSSVRKNSAMWGAQFTQRMFKDNTGLLSFQIFDILHQRNNVERSINNLTITDTRSAVLGSYFLVSFQYRLNTMVKKRFGKTGQDKNRNRKNVQNNRQNRNRNTSWGSSKKR